VNHLDFAELNRFIQHVNVLHRKTLSKHLNTTPLIVAWREISKRRPQESLTHEVRTESIQTRGLVYIILTLNNLERDEYP